MTEKETVQVPPLLGWEASKTGLPYSQLILEAFGGQCPHGRNPVESESNWVFHSTMKTDEEEEKRKGTSQTQPLASAAVRAH